MGRAGEGPIGPWPRPGRNRLPLRTAVAARPQRGSSRDEDGGAVDPVGGQITQRLVRALNGYGLAVTCMDSETAARWQGAAAQGAVADDPGSGASSTASWAFRASRDPALLLGAARRLDVPAHRAGPARNQGVGRRNQ